MQLTRPRTPDSALQWIARKANRVRSAKLRTVPKLEDANNAGGKHSNGCTLILTEGDSAKVREWVGLRTLCV